MNYYLLGFLFLQQCFSLPEPQSINYLPISSPSNKLEGLDVKCGRTGMSVTLTFDHPFEGIVYSKGHYRDPKCNYKNEGGTYRNSFRFWIPADSCGTTGNLDTATEKEDMEYTNTIIIQNDPFIQEVWDTARTLRCSWYVNMKKSIESGPILVEGPQKFPITFDSRSLNTLGNIESGQRRSGLSTPISGYVSSTGYDRSLVIYVQDDTGSYDANVVSCYWRSGNGQEVPLIDANGCLLRSDLMSQFEKVRNPNNLEADLQMFASLKRMNLEDDPQFSVSCEVELCESNCLPTCALGPFQGHEKHGLSRSKRQSNWDREFAASDFSKVPKGIVLYPDQNMNDVPSCYLGQEVTVTIAILSVLVWILGCLSVYLALRLWAVRAGISKLDEE